MDKIADHFIAPLGDAAAAWPVYGACANGTQTTDHSNSSSTSRPPRRLALKSSVAAMADEVIE